ncbi:MAG TPA: glycoside hydrolase family 15 protein [Symbiobacteriaceae bacterium]|nr:glycoside hydrolase family 15 protein [Symbiobacteriaceae bacterium]
MARPLVIGNGQLLICFDERLVMRDLYYPQVGELNHIIGGRNQLGFWVEGAFSWLGDDPEWERRLAYRPGSLVTDSEAIHGGLGLAITVRDAVYHRKNIFLRHLRVKNLRDRPREVRIMTTHDFDIDGTDVGDTAFWDPTQGVMYHYKRNRWFVMCGRGPHQGIYQFATGRKRFQGAEGTWRDAEDGLLEGNPISQGAVDSTVSIRATLGPFEEVDFHFWLVCADDYQSARHLHSKVMETGPAAMLEEVEGYWRNWVKNGRYDLSPLPADMQSAFWQSLLVIRTQADGDGAILAATDTEILAGNRDHYAYMWPRDGAFVAAALDRAGYRGVTRKFYEFCRRVLSPYGYFWHKYNPDGTIGSSWHPLAGAKGPQLPIQEDETALVLWALGNHYRISKDQEFVSSLYTDLVHPAANFLWRYRDERTRLPMESYDLWEERRGIFTFTVAAVAAGLAAAAEMATAVGDSRRAARYAGAAAEVKEALLKYLWSEERGCFLRGLYVRKDGELVPDTALESSTMAVFLLGVLPADDPRVEATVRALERGLWSNTMIGGMARYVGDPYYRVSDDPAVSPGNPWIACTLWLARWYAARAKTQADLQPAFDLARWAMQRSLSTGVLPEQVNPFTGEPISVAPLTWSHAVLMDVLLDLAEASRTLPKS